MAQVSTMPEFKSDDAGSVPLPRSGLDFGSSRRAKPLECGATRLCRLVAALAARGARLR